MFTTSLVAMNNQLRTGADQGVKQTRKGEDIVASTSLVLKGRCECIRGVHTKMPNTDRPPVG